MDCADHCICGDGDTDRAGSDLMYVGVLDEKSVLEFDFQDALLIVCRILEKRIISHERIHLLLFPTLPMTERVRSFHSAVS